MKMKEVINIIILGTIGLYCAKVFIQASVNATTNSFETYFAILGWTMYFVGLVMFIGGFVVTGINLVIQSTKKSDK